MNKTNGDYKLKEREHSGGGLGWRFQLHKENMDEENNLTKMKDIVYEIKIEAKYNEEYLFIP